MKILSMQNDRVKKWCQLKEKKYRDERNLFLIEGEHLLFEALKNGIVKEIITTEDVSYDNLLPHYYVTKEIMKKISDQVTISSVIAVCEKLKKSEIVGPVIVLDGLQDPGNLGTIIRSAAAFSIPNIILSSTSVDLYNPKVIRSTEGMLFFVNIVRENLEHILPILKQRGYTIYGTDVLKGEDTAHLSFSSHSAFLIGNEGKGLSEVARNYCDNFLYISMNSCCESLNASVSASIIMYEFSKKSEPYE